MAAIPVALLFAAAPGASGSSEQGTPGEAYTSGLEAGLTDARGDALLLAGGLDRVEASQRIGVPGSSRYSDPDYRRGYDEGYQRGYYEGVTKGRASGMGSGGGFALGFFLGLLGVIIAAATP
jgi:hypothetical protein